MVNKVLAVKTDEGIDMLLDAERKAWDGNMLCGQEGDADSVLLKSQRQNYEEPRKPKGSECRRRGEKGKW